MTTSTEDGGTSNSERIAAEIERAAGQAVERFPGYRKLLAQAAMECYLLTSEHDEQRININQKYDELIRKLAGEIGRSEVPQEES